MPGFADRLGLGRTWPFGPAGGNRKAASCGTPEQQPKFWPQALAEHPLARFVPFSSLLGESDVITRGGDYLRVWRLEGVAFECADEVLIAERHEALCGLLRSLAGGPWAVWTHRLHRTIRDALQLPSTPGFAQDLALAYQGHIGHRPLLSHELYLSLVYRPPARDAARGWGQAARTREALFAEQANALAEMAERTALVERALRGLRPRLLGGRTERGRRYSELAEFLGYLVNGQWRAVPQAAGPLYRTLPMTRLSFGGDKLELRHPDGCRYAALVDIKEYPDAVEPGTLNALLYEGSEFIETQSFSSLARRDAMRALTLQRDQLIASEDVVASQIAAMDQALDELGDGQFCMGEYHYSLVVFGDNVADAGRRAALAMGAVGETSSLQMSPVDLVADAAWFAQWPGNWQWRPREAILSSRAFAALASAHNFPSGKRDGNPWGEALVLLRTPSGQPFYLNLHASPEGQDSLDQKLPGNTLIIGSTGVGKTTLEMFLLALTRKWQPAPRLVLFDLDRGCEIAVRALGGRYLALQAGEPTGINPLQQAPTPARLQQWEQLVRTCLETSALPLMPTDERAIADAIRAVARMPAPLRRLSTVRQNLPKTGNNSLHDRLGRWCVGGPLGWVFDQADDRLLDLGTSPVLAFDTTDFLNLPEVRTPIMMVLLQRMAELVDGHRLIYVISEFWKALDHPVFSDFAKTQQKTIRKHNGLGIFDTQSPSDVLRHSIGRTMVEQSVTKIFLANPDAVREEYVDGFGLSQSEFELVVGLGAQGGRRFLVKQGTSSALCELDLDGLEDHVAVLSATTDNIALLDELRQRLGDEPACWLPAFRAAVRARKAGLQSATTESGGTQAAT